MLLLHYIISFSFFVLFKSEFELDKWFNAKVHEKNQWLATRLTINPFFCTLKCRLHSVTCLPYYDFPKKKSVLCKDWRCLHKPSWMRWLTTRLVIFENILWLSFTQLNGPIGIRVNHLIKPIFIAKAVWVLLPLESTVAQISQIIIPLT